MKNYLLILAAAFIVLTGCNKNNSKSESSTGQNTEQAVDKNLQTVEFKCDGITCTSCEDAIKNKVKKLDGIKTVESDYKTKITKVTFASGIVSSADIENAIDKAGYHAEVYKPETEQKK